MTGSGALITLGLLFLAGLAADYAGRRTRLPRVTLLIACGLIAGKAGFDAVPREVQALYGPLSIVALTMVAFLLGGSLSARALRTRGAGIIAISLTVVLTSLVVVAGGLWAFGVDPAMAILLGGIATATAPAATYDVIRQSRIDTPFTRTLKGIVAIDDAWGLIAFSLALVVVQSLGGHGVGPDLAKDAAVEIIGALAIGVGIGFPAAALTGRITAGEPLRIEALGLVFLTAGISQWLGVSYLLAGMTVGAVIVNRARHHTLAFHEIEHLQWPFMILFFILAGATLDLRLLWQIGALGLGYVVLRTVSRVIGGWIGAALANLPRAERPWYGVALLPQAGVAIGMALIAAETVPALGPQIMAVTIGTTILFELIGPLATALAIRRTVGPAPVGSSKAR